MPQNKFLIAEMLTKRGVIVNNQLTTNCIEFYSYPSVNELKQIQVEEVKDSRENIKNCEIGILIGQLPRGFEISYILFILSKMFNDSSLFTCYSKGSNYNNPSKTSDYCFLNANAYHVNILLKYHRALRPDVNGVWVAHNAEGLDILNHIEEEIRINPQISHTYQLDYNYCENFAVRGISIEIQNRYRQEYLLNHYNRNFNAPCNHLQQLTSEFEQVSQELTNALQNLKDLPSIVTDMVLIHATKITEKLQNLSNDNKKLTKINKRTP